MYIGYAESDGNGTVWAFDEGSMTYYPVGKVSNAANIDPMSGQDLNQSGPVRISQDNQNALDRIKRCMGDVNNSPCEWNIKGKYCSRTGESLEKSIHWCDNSVRIKPI